MYLTNENKIKLNKAFLFPDSNKTIFNKIITIDYYFTYIYDLKIVEL